MYCRTQDNQGFLAENFRNHRPRLSYLRLQKMIGIIGTAQPFVLIPGKFLIDGWGIQGSISAYYYTGMRDVFVGMLCAVAVFLISYNMYKRNYIAGRLAGTFAVCVAILPTMPSMNPSKSVEVIGKLHLASAAAFFLTIAYFSLALFTKTDPAKAPTPQKLQRNVVYRACGFTILACLALMGLLQFVQKKISLSRLHPLLWLQSIAVVAFGISWLIKGGTLLQDN